MERGFNIRRICHAPYRTERNHIVIMLDESSVDDLQKAVGALIRKERKRQHMSQEVLATLLNSNHRVMARLEGGRGNPTVRTLAKIAAVLDVPLHRLIPRDF